LDYRDREEVREIAARGDGSGCLFLVFIGTVVFVWLVAGQPWVKARDEATVKCAARGMHAAWADRMEFVCVAGVKP